jgi:TrmH family RNA methyltransferase
MLLGIKTLIKLNQKKYRSEYGYFIVEGKKGVLEAIVSGKKIVQLVMTRQFADQERDFGENQEKLVVDEKDFAKIAETVTPSGIAAVVKIPNYTLETIKKTKLIAVLEDIRDPGNLGTMIRTADWFGLDAILLIGGADPYQAKVVRSSMGSIFHLPIVTSQNGEADLIELKKAGFKIVVTRPELADLRKIVNFRDKTAIVFGNESKGTSTEIDQLADQFFSIPQHGKAESLNVAVSFGIVINDITKIR